MELAALRVFLNPRCGARMVNLLLRGETLKN